MPCNTRQVVEAGGWLAAGGVGWMLAILAKLAKPIKQGKNDASIPRAPCEHASIYPRTPTPKAAGRLPRPLARRVSVPALNLGHIPAVGIFVPAVCRLKHQPPGMLAFHRAQLCADELRRHRPP